jgi:23S rRNA-/tRNA-specific pseudouridylate synthase
MQLVFSACPVNGSMPPASAPSFTVTRQEQGLPLLQLLRQRLNLSGKQAKAYLDRREVFVNDARVWMAKHACQAGDRIRVNRSSSAAPSSLPVLWESPTLVAVNKPPGRVSDREPDSIEAEIRRQLNRPDLRALHRLDRDTTGVLLFTPPGPVRERYLSLFREKFMQKEYRLILRGQLKGSSEVIRSRLDGKEAETRIEVLRHHRGYAEARCRIPTGRKHQIRRHLQQRQCTVAGDRHYNTRASVPAAEQALHRQMLHAESIAFTCPVTAEPIRITAPLPEDYRKALKQLGLSQGKRRRV